MKKIFVIFGIIAFAAVSAFLVFKNLSSETLGNKAVVIEGTEIALLSEAPSGWVLDRKSAESMGICALYTLENRNFDTSPLLIYPRLASKGGDEAIAASVLELSTIYRNHSDKFVLEEKADFTTKLGQTFKVRYYLNGPAPRSFEAVAYLTYKERLYISVYSATNQDDFLNGVRSFYEYLESVSPYAQPLNGADKCYYPTETSR